MANPQLMTGLGAALSIFLSASGAASGSAASGTFALQSSSTGFVSFIPIVISGVLAIYGAIVGVILSHRMFDEKLDASDGYRHLCSGLAVGLACLVSGSGIATFVSQNTWVVPQKRSDQEEALLSSKALPSPVMGAKFTIKMGLVLVFLEAIGLYGLIVGLILIG
jgi:V-type H+-transporting ATPase proteolipid subunit